MTGGYTTDSGYTWHIKTDKTEMMTMSGNNWRLVNSANLPIAIVDSAALTINNQVYLFGNLSK